LNFFFARMQKSMVYLFCGVFFLAVLFLGSEEGGIAFLIPALISFAQFFYPTFIGWVLVFLPVSVMSLLWLYGLVIGIIKMNLYPKPGASSDIDYSLFFILTALISTLLSVWLWNLRIKNASKSKAS
jgi:hypothetical protein